MGGSAQPFGFLSLFWVSLNIVCLAYGCHNALLVPHKMNRLSYKHGTIYKGGQLHEHILHECCVDTMSPYWDAQNNLIIHA